jgi:hypothetical protein
MTTKVKTASELGRSNLSKGKAWMYSFAAWVRAAGFPGFDIISQNGRGDGGGLLDWTIECKNTAGDGLSAAVDQVLRDQAARGTRWHVVAKKRQQRGDPGDGYAVMTVGQWAQMARVLDDRRVQAIMDEILEETRW